VSGLRPAVSVVVPVRDGEAFLAEALESVLRQEPAPLEVVVVDDGSTDGSRALAERFGPPVRVLSQRNAGPAAARNRGVEATGGEVLAFLDADDLWLPGKLRAQVGHLAEHPESDVVIGLTQPVRREPADDPDGVWRPCAPVWLALLLGCASIRRSAFDRVGPFAPELRLGEDVDWFLRAREKGLRIDSLPETVLLHRRHHTNVTGDEARRDAHLLTSLKRSLDRRRNVASGAAPDLEPVFDREVLQRLDAERLRPGAIA